MALAIALITLASGCDWGKAHQWDETERRELKSLSLAALEPLAANLTNSVGDSERAQILGHRLFLNPA